MGDLCSFFQVNGDPGARERLAHMFNRKWLVCSCACQSYPSFTESSASVLELRQD